MTRLSALAAAILALWGAALPAQEFSGLARLDVAGSQIRDAGEGAEVTLYLSQPVPFRAFTLDAPMRLVLDFREVDWRGARRESLLNSDRISDLRFGTFRPGWSRMVADLAEPLVIDRAGMEVSAIDGTAVLRVRLRPADAAAFAAASGAPPDPAWDGTPLPDPVAFPPQDADGPIVVAIDPGHGGIDPGAEREGMVEAQLMLTLAIELSEAISRIDGFRPVLTRREDVFVPLAERMTIARAAGADVLISLHADALEADSARGATVYTLSAEALDQASQRMAERHERSDLLAGVDLTGQDDTVATVLMDLARLETAPKAERLADMLVAALREAGAAVNSQPRRKAPLAVLNAADFPSVLIEVGFLSDPGDRAALASAEGRGRIVAAIVAALGAWAAEEAARAPLVRQ